MKLYLIRHGKTEANERHLYCGSTDLPLSNAGIRELQGLCYKIPEKCLFFTSGMLRTEETLYYLFGEREHTRDERFREIDFGAFEMQSYEDLKDREDYQIWISGDNDKNVPPGGESGEQMTVRVLEGLRDIRNQQKDTLLITHGGVIAAIMEHLFPEENKNRYEWQPSPGGGYVIAEESKKYERLRPVDLQRFKIEISTA